MNRGENLAQGNFGDGVSRRRNNSKPTGERPGLEDPGVAELLARIEEHLAALRAAQRAANRDVLTVVEAARFLRCSPSTVERLIADGRIRAAKLNTTMGKGRRARLRIRRVWLERFLADMIGEAGNSSEPHARGDRRPNQAGTDFIGE